MYRVAVCEDDPALRVSLKEQCDSILTRMEVEHEVVPFASAAELRAAMMLGGGERFDLLCLDILMPGENGMEFAYELRREGSEVSILFITSSTDFLLDGYGVRPIQYLLKPVDPDGLARALADDLRLNHAPRTVSVTVRGRTTVMPRSDILYVESRNHGCCFIMKDRESFFWLSMAQAEELLPKEQFCRCHNSYLINLAQVVRSDTHDVELSGGTVLPVSRRFADKFQSALTRYLNRK